MNIAKRVIWTAISGLSICMMSACTTVDLSQITLEQRAVATVNKAQNVVQLASLSMMSLFEDKGWCEVDLKEKTQTAASVLLNGLDEADDEKASVRMMGIDRQQLVDDIKLANAEVEQITKAAEIYLATANENTDMGLELSLLESALVSAREAVTGFEGVVDQNQSSDIQSGFEHFEASIEALKTITDVYGERMRGQIAARSNREHF